MGSELIVAACAAVQQRVGPDLTVTFITTTISPVLLARVMVHSWLKEKWSCERENGVESHVMSHEMHVNVRCASRVTVRCVPM